MDETAPRNLIILVLAVFLLFIIQTFFFANSFNLGFAFLFLIIIYFAFFIIRDYSFKKKEIKENLKIKDRTKIRIAFWR